MDVASAAGVLQKTVSQDWSSRDYPRLRRGMGHQIIPRMPGRTAEPRELRPLLLGEYSSGDLARAFLPHRRLGDDDLPTPVGLFERTRLSGWAGAWAWTVRSSSSAGA